MNKRVVILNSEDWEGLFIDGKLVDEGHSLTDGNHPIIYWGKIFQKYKFTEDEIFISEVSKFDDELLYSTGCFPKNLSELKTKYVDDIKFKFTGSVVNPKYWVIFEDEKYLIESVNETEAIEKTIVLLKEKFNLNYKIGDINFIWGGETI